MLVVRFVCTIHDRAAAIQRQIAAWPSIHLLECLLYRREHSAHMSFAYAVTGTMSHRCFMGAAHTICSGFLVAAYTAANEGEAQQVTEAQFRVPNPFAAAQHEST